MFDVDGTILLGAVMVLLGVWLFLYSEFINPEWTKRQGLANAPLPRRLGNIGLIMCGILLIIGRFFTAAK